MENLVKLLYENARLTEKQLATMLGGNEEDIARKISELERSGVVRGYKALVDWDKLDEEKVSALIELRVTPKRDAGFDEIAGRIMEFEEVESVYLMSGGYDLMVIITGRTFKEVAMFVSKRLSLLDSVTSTATHFILRRYKDMGVVMCDADERDDRGSFSL